LVFVSLKYRVEENLATKGRKVKGGKFERPKITGPKNQKADFLWRKIS
jgi:hypothetical protein